MIPWWAWPLLWIGAVLGALAVVAGLVIFLLKGGFKVLQEFSDSVSVMDGVLAGEPDPREKDGRQPLPVGSIIEGWVGRSWTSYYQSYAAAKDLSRERRRKLRMLAKERAGRPQTLKDIAAAEAAGQRQ